MMPNRHRTPSAVATILLALLLSACSSESAQPSGASTPGGSDQTGASQTATDPATSTETAEDVFQRIEKEVPTAKLVKVYTEDDDPNKLLGRPNGYDSKIAFSDSRVPKKELEFAEKDAIERGGSIEVFPDASGAKARSDYIQAVQSGGALGSEYHYLDGPILVRVTGNLTPTKAKVYEAALG